MYGRPVKSTLDGGTVQVRSATHLPASRRQSAAGPSRSAVHTHRYRPTHRVASGTCCRSSQWRRRPDGHQGTIIYQLVLVRHVFGQSTLLRNNQPSSTVAQYSQNNLLQHGEQHHQVTSLPVEKYVTQDKCHPVWKTKLKNCCSVPQLASIMYLTPA